jgi:hypothetical protein
MLIGLTLAFANGQTRRRLGSVFVRRATPAAELLDAGLACGDIRERRLPHRGWAEYLESLSSPQEKTA